MVRTSCVFNPNFTPAYLERIFAANRRNGTITEDDERLIRDYIAECQTLRGLSHARAQVNAMILCHWRRHLSRPYREATTAEVMQAVERIKTATSARGRPYAQNTLRDYIKELKPFCAWLVENGHASLAMEKVRRIRTPDKNRRTTQPAGLLTETEVRAILEACTSSRDRALFAVLYEAGCRIGELARLAWADVIFDEYGAGLYVADTKTSKRRYARLVMSAPYLAAWKADYPVPADADLPVFITARRAPFTYDALRMLIVRTARRAGIEKRVHAHLFRKSRITHMVQQNYQESVIKEAMWGNLKTDMLETYVILAEKDIDAEYLERMGVQRTAPEGGGKNAAALRPRQCTRCGTLNGPVHLFCHRCGLSLTEEAALNLEQAVDKIEETAAYQRAVASAVETLRRELGLAGAQPPDKTT